ncbi:hypothetical protein DPEC_G00360640 [Dallia pectoralis]|uniref:Uncharacterized protein n=1 Tax=Dallia pectoralis TaxID=75939 RepID=A0ACC2F0V8_DALPE|nr:hypothetical protein DPEC_G00360640 [Dallia pectoralis]
MHTSNKIVPVTAECTESFSQGNHAIIILTPLTVALVRSRQLKSDKLETNPQKLQSPTLPRLHRRSCDVGASEKRLFLQKVSRSRLDSIWDDVRRNGAL